MKNIKVTSAIVAVAPMVLLSSALSVSNAQADVPGKSLVMSVYLDTEGGAKLLAGDYEAAIADIQSRRPSDNMRSLADATNLCVAYTMTQKWAAAESSCTAAINGARSNDADDRFDLGAGRAKRLATAYSNRAVFNWMRNARQAAVTDVRRARSLSAGLEFVVRNWMALNGEPDTTAHPTVASIRP